MELVKHDNQISKKRIFDLKLSLSFQTDFVVKWKGKENKTVVIYNNNYFEKQIITSKNIDKIAFGALVSNPHKIKDQIIRLAIFEQGSILREIAFFITEKRKYCGWFVVEYGETVELLT